MPDENIVQKIRKLLALSRNEGATVHEASAAAALAQRLMARYSVDAAVLAEAPGAAQEDESFVSTAVLRGKGPMPTWVLTLAGGVARANRLKSSYSSSRYGHTQMYYGPAQDILNAQELLGWLVGEVERLETEERKRTIIHGKGEGKAFWTSFRNGCAVTIYNRIIEAADEERETIRKELTDSSLAKVKGMAERYKDAALACDVETIAELDRECAADPALEAELKAWAMGVLAEPTYALARLDTALVKLDARPDRIEAWQKASGMKFSKAKSTRYSSSQDGWSAGKEAGKRAQLKAGRNLPG